MSKTDRVMKLAEDVLRLEAEIAKKKRELEALLGEKSSPSVAPKAAAPKVAAVAKPEASKPGPKPERKKPGPKPGAKAAEKAPKGEKLAKAPKAAAKGDKKTKVTTRQKLIDLFNNAPTTVFALRTIPEKIGHAEQGPSVVTALYKLVSEGLVRKVSPGQFAAIAKK